MRLLTLLVAVVLSVLGTLAHAADGMVVVESPYDFKETATRLEAAITQSGLHIFARVDHAADAAKIGKSLRPTEVFIFGNPKGGTPFMECAQSVGIDLPMKALVWEDASGKTWVGYNDPAYLAQRHGTPDCPVVPKLSKVLAGIAESATAE